jgi:BirA family biotin operon repressor/biotin-[acetyl-CoA-carboxylase] ligase
MSSMSMQTCPLDIGRIEREIADLSTPFQLIYLAEVDSTNRVAAALTDEEFQGGTAVLTDYQTAGRGRRERVWLAPPRTGLLMSLVFPMPPVPGDALLLMALAVADALRVEGADARIKWPNDVLIHGRKVCGILAERVTRQGRPFAIVGAGTNVLSHPDLPGAGSVAGELGRSVDRTGLAIEVFKFLDLWYRSLSERPDAVFEAWERRLETIGREILVSDGAEEWTGTALGVERTGALRVRAVDGSVRTVLAGDVSIRSAEGFTTG